MRFIFSAKTTADVVLLALKMSRADPTYPHLLLAEMDDSLNRI
jgi:hypothetical protein